MKENKARSRSAEHSIFGMWKEIVGPEIASHTRVIDVQGGQLTVEVDSAPLLNELSTYFRKDILESIRQVEELRGVHSLRFRAGAF